MDDPFERHLYDAGAVLLQVEVLVVDRDTAPVDSLDTLVSHI